MFLSEYVGGTDIISALFFYLFFFFFNDTATTEIYTLSLHDALPIWRWVEGMAIGATSYLVYLVLVALFQATDGGTADTRSEEHTSELQSQSTISYAVFCLKKKITSTLLQFIPTSMHLLLASVLHHLFDWCPPAQTLLVHYR